MGVTWLGRVKRRVAKWREALQVCACCGRPVDRGEFTCEDEGCRLGALEGQAMLAPLHAWPSLGWSVRFRTPSAFQGTFQGTNTDLTQPSCLSLKI